MKRVLYCFSFLMLVIALVGGMAWSLDCDSCTATATGVGGDITATGNFNGFRNGEHMHAPVGVEATISGGWSDVDATQYSTTKDTVNPSASGSGWNVTPFENPTDGCWSNISAKKTATQAGTDTIDFHCTDNARCGSLGNDGDLDFSLVVDFVGMSDFKGPTSWYEDDCVTFSVAVGPATHSPDTSTTHGNYVKWYYSIGSSETIQALPAGCSYSYSTVTGRSTCSISSSSLDKGTYKIYARVETPATISTGNGPYHIWDVEVYPILPTNVEGNQCSSSGSGGCSTGSCGSSGGGALVPQIRKAVVPPPSFAIGTYGKDKSGVACDTQPSFTVIKSCNTVKWYFTSCEGTNIPVSFPQTTTAPPTYANPYPVQVGTWTLNRIGAQDATSWSYTATGIDGTLYTYDSAPSADPDVRVTFPALTRIDYPDGTYTTFTNVGGGSFTTSNYVPTSPNPTAIHTTAFNVDSHDRVTSTTGDDGIKVTVSYLAGSITPAYPEIVETINTKGTTTTDDDEILSTTAYSYNADGRLSQVDQDGKQTGYAYTIDNGVVTGITVTNLSASPQIVTQYTYASNSTTITQKHPTDSSKDQVTVTEFFTHNGEKTYVWRVTDPMGNVIKNGVKVPDGTYIADKGSDYEIEDNSKLFGKPFKTVDQNNNETEYEYNDSTGTVSLVTYPDSTTEEYTYYTVGTNPAVPTIYTRTIKNRRGNYTHYVRDTSTLYQVDAVKTSEPVGGVEPTNWGAITADKEYSYYPDDALYGQVGRLMTESVPNVDGNTAQVTSYVYHETVNGNEKLRDGATSTSYKYWDSSNSVYVDKYSTTHYDDAGKVLWSTDANSRTTIYEYDAKGRQLKTIYQITPEIADESSYTCCNLQWTKDSDGRETHYAYDNAGRASKTWTNISGQSETAPLVTYAYNDFGNKSSVTTYSNASTARTTAYTYDKQNRVTKIDYPGDLGDEEFGYTNAGNVQWKKDGSNFVTLYRYDTYYRLTNVYYNYTGSLTTISYPGTADVTYSYLNGTSMKSSMVDSTGTSSYSYDYKDRLTSYTPPKPSGHGAVTYTYNNLDNKTSVTNGSIVINYSYFANGWLRDVKRGTSLIASFSYDEVGNRTRTDYGNETYQINSYVDNDTRYHLSKIEYAYRCAVNQPVDIQGSVRFNRDNVGNPLTWSAYDTSSPAVNIYGKVYTYDQNGRLDSVNYPGKMKSGLSYDWAGNRNAPDDMTYNTVDQLTAWTNHHAYDYFGNGDLYHQKSSAGTTEKTYSYTSSELLAGISHTGVARQSEMIWDEEANRIGFRSSSRSSDTDTYYYVNDITAGIPAVIEEIDPANAASYYIREPGGALLARVKDSTVIYYHFDELGNTLYLTTSSGTVSDKYTYDVWGNITSHVGDILQPYQFGGRIGYYTHYQDQNLNLLQLGVRLYDPEIGRFTQRDPVVDPSSTGYEYANSAPSSYVDPSGYYSTDGPCNVVAPDLNNLVKEMVNRFKNSKACRKALQGVQCYDYFQKMLSGKGESLSSIKFSCINGFYEGKPYPAGCPGKNDIYLFLPFRNSNDRASILMHELTHACAWNSGMKWRAMGDYSCNRCDMKWTGDGNKTWEGSAEKVRHACFPETIKKHPKKPWWKF